MMQSLVRRKKMVGVVVSDKMDKTVVVEVVKLLSHTKYKKYVKVKRRYKAHDEKERCKVGDKVLIVETRPMSKEKRWIVKEIIGEEKMIPIEEALKNDTGEIEA